MRRGAAFGVGMDDDVRRRELGQHPVFAGDHLLVSGFQALVRVELDPDQSLEAAHQKMIACENRVLAEFPAADIIIHADPKGRAAPHEGAFARSSRV